MGTTMTRFPFYYAPTPVQRLETQMAADNLRLTLQRRRAEREAISIRQQFAHERRMQRFSRSGMVSL
jgi:hypothetical protein